MKLIVTILENTFEESLAAIRGIGAEHDGVELRAENLADVDLAALRAASDKTIILTHRGRSVSAKIVQRAVDAGIDLVDVEYDDTLDRRTVGRFRERIVLSHHDFVAMPDIESLLPSMLSIGCAQTKLAVTPANFRDNQRLLLALRDRKALTVIGMGAAGLYARIAAPMFGSAFVFVSSDERPAAPGQISLRRALEIHGKKNESRPQRSSAPLLFAIVGDPASHSLSPGIHNQLFREKGVNGAYTICETSSFEDIAVPFAAGEPFAPAGLSVTAPFKEEAFAFAAARGAAIAENAGACKAANTLVRRGDETILADNTDVDGFLALLSRGGGQGAVVGSGGTARAAIVAMQRMNIEVTIYNRTPSKAAALAVEFGVKHEALDKLSRFDGNVVIDTTPSGASINLPTRSDILLIEAGYGSSSRQTPLVTRKTGLDLLNAQARRQNELFLEAFHESR